MTIRQSRAAELTRNAWAVRRSDRRLAKSYIRLARAWLASRATQWHTGMV